MAVHDDWFTTEIRFQSLYMWAEDIDSWAESKGWNDDYESHGEPEHIAMMHSELSEALEAHRVRMADDPLWWCREDGKPEGIATEMADCVIRILHWAARHDVDLGEVMMHKMAYNETRTFRHGGRVI